MCRHDWPQGGKKTGAGAGGVEETVERPKMSRDVAEDLLLTSHEDIEEVARGG